MFNFLLNSDEQLLFEIAFNIPVKLNGILIRGVSLDTAPKTIHLFINQPSMTFDDTSVLKASHRFEMSSLEHNEPLPIWKFTGVTSLAIFVEDNQGEGEVTEVLGITPLGIAPNAANVGDLQKDTNKE